MVCILYIEELSNLVNHIVNLIQLVKKLISVSIGSMNFLH